ncbi:MAG: hypothetical protein NVS9B10_06910 [Nevskia sp.]
MLDSSSTTTAAPLRRDGITALILLAVVGATLLLGYRSSPGVSGPTAPASVADAQPPPATDGYDLDAAMALASQEVPPETQSYYFFAFVNEVPAVQEIGDLAEKLRQASKEHDYLGISGPDAERNRSNLLSALAANRGRDLSGAVIIYLGPPRQREEVVEAVRNAGAQLRFLVFPRATAEARPGI